MIFIDEAESLLVARDSAHWYQREALNEILQGWDGLSRRPARVTVLTATNLPHMLDDAVLRRLPRRFMVPLPTKEGREAILAKLLRNDELAADVNLEVIASKTNEFSGSDLFSMVQMAGLAAVKRLLADEAAAVASGSATTSTLSSSSSSSKTLSSSSSSSSSDDGSENKPHPHTIVVVSQADLLSALESIRPSFTAKSTSANTLMDWDRQYGEGSKKLPQKAWGFSVSGGQEKSGGGGDQQQQQQQPQQPQQQQVASSRTKKMQ